MWRWVTLLYLCSILALHDCSFTFAFFLFLYHLQVCYVGGGSDYNGCVEAMLRIVGPSGSAGINGRQR